MRPSRYDRMDWTDWAVLLGGCCAFGIALVLVESGRGIAALWRFGARGARAVWRMGRCW